MLRTLCFILTISSLSCAPNDANVQKKLSPDAFESMLKSDTTVQLVDVRTPGEFQSGYIAGAKLINIQDADFSKKISQLDKNRPVLVYCAVGGRSANAAGQLFQLGFTNVYDLKGGMTAWKEKEKPIMR